MTYQLLHHEKKMEVEVKPKYVPTGNPNWKKGVSGNPAGKPVGAIDRLQKAAILAATEKGGPSPLEFMLAIMQRDEEKLRAWKIPILSVTPQLRMRAAENALPYVCRKAPVAIDGGEGKPLFIPEDVLANLPDSELFALRRAMIAVTMAESAGEISEAIDEARTIDVADESELVVSGDAALAIKSASDGSR